MTTLLVITLHLGVGAMVAVTLGPKVRPARRWLTVACWPVVAVLWLVWLHPAGKAWLRFRISTDANTLPRRPAKGRATHGQAR